MFNKIIDNIINRENIKNIIKKIKTNIESGTLNKNEARILERLKDELKNIEI
jgi:hypothetical protein